MRKTLLTLALCLAVAGTAHAQSFKAKLDGFNAAGVPIATNANGNAQIEVIDGGTAIRFKVNVSGIDNLLMAHIHLSPVPLPVDPTGTAAGPIAFWFAGSPRTRLDAEGEAIPATTNTQTVNGRLAEGFILTDGQLEGTVTVTSLIAALCEQRGSVVVHTDDLDPNTPTGVAGDSRAGELRGTIVPIQPCR